MADTVTTSFGQMVEPGWIGGAQMPGSPDLGAKFLTGMQAGASAAAQHATAIARQQSMENQLAQYALRAQQMQQSREMDSAKFGMAQDKMKWDMEKFQDNMNWQKFKEDQDSKDRDRMADWRDAQGVIKQNKFDEFVQRKHDEADATSGFNQAASLLDSQPGTPPYERDILKLQAEYGKLPGTSAAIQTAAANLMHNANTVRDQNYRALVKDEQLFNDNIGQTLGGGNALLQNKNWYMNPQDLPDEKVGGWGFGIGGTSTGRKQIKDAAGNVLATVDMGTIKGFQQKRADLDARWQNMAAPINHPDIGVVPASGGMVTFQSSSGKQFTIPADNLQQAKERDPGLTVIPQQQ